MADELKASNKEYRSIQLKLVRFLDQFVEAKVNNMLKRAAEEDGGDEVVAEKAVVEEEEENQPVKKKAAKEHTGPVECDGNIVTGAKCPIPIAEREKAPDTKEGKEKHPTCKKCKRAIINSRKAAEKVEEKEEEKEDTGPVECDGNVLLETRCPIAVVDRKKAPDTKEGGHKHPTCKHCKRAIAKTRKELRVGEEGAEEEAE